MNDGSCCFMDFLPTDIIGFNNLYDYLGTLVGVKKTGILTDNITGAWMDFRYRGHKFSVNNVMGEYWFFVRDPECPDEILNDVVKYCAGLLEK